jgi:FkbM family methyltransferase
MSLRRQPLKVLADSMAPAARAWIRYSPLTMGKSWLWDRYFWRTRTFTCRTKFGMQVTGNTQDLIQSFLYYFGTWEPNITSWVTSRLNPGDYFIDVGANIGYYSLLAARLVGERGRVVAIEAHPSIYSLLNKNVELNRLRNIRTVCAAAADKKGSVQMFLAEPSNIGGTSMFHNKRNFRSSGIETPALPLCDLLSDEEVRRARIIKIDVEGAELSVLRGLESVLGQLRPDAEIIMEVNSDAMAQAGESAQELLSIMRRRGFHAFRLENYYDAAHYLVNTPISGPTAFVADVAPAPWDLVFSRSGY